MKAKLFVIVKSLLVVSLMGCVASVLWAGFHYVNTAPRFNVKRIVVTGLKNVDDEEVLGRLKLQTNSNTNIFAVDMADVRARVEQIQWVRSAVVQRVLPDRIIIKVVEREAIGQARIQGHIYEFDNEAALLEPQSTSSLKLPILIGLQENDAEGNLKKIAMYRKVIADLDASSFAAVIVNQSNDVSIVREDDALIVVLGVDDFKDRWSHYLALKSTIAADYKDVVRVDLRFQNKVILSTQGDVDGGKVIWDGKKKSL